MDLMKYTSNLQRLCALSLVAALTLFGGIVEASDAAEPLTIEDVMKMVKAGLSPGIIIATINNQPGNFDLSPDKLVALKEAGVDDEIVSALIKSGSASSGASRSKETGEAERTLPDGTEVTLRLRQQVSSATAKVGDRVDFEACVDVTVNEVVVIREGARAWGNVITARPKKSFGRAGKLDFTIDYVKAIDAQNVRLRSTQKTMGKENFGKAGVVSFIALPLGFFVKGKNVEIAAGTEFTVFADGDRAIKLNTGEK